MKGSNVFRLTLITLIIGFGLHSAFTPAKASAAQSSIYAGKQVRIITGFPPGGSLDLRARLFARHLPKYIPGKPSIIVQAMPGAGGLIAANHVFGVAKKDGLTMIHFPSSTIMNAFLAPAKVKYDVRKTPIIWAQADSWLTVIDPKATGVTSAEQILQSSTKLAAGGSGVTSLRSLRPKLALELYGVEHTWVTGYRGTAGLFAAFDRGEIHLIEVPIASFKRSILPRQKEGKVAILWQTGTLSAEEKFERSALMADLPTFTDLLPDDKKSGPAWEAWKAAVVPQAFQSAIGLPPGSPAKAVAILSAALEKMEKDPAYQRDAEKVMGPTPTAVVGDGARQLVETGLTRLFDEYKTGVEYLRELPKKKNK